MKKLIFSFLFLVLATSAYSQGFFFNNTNGELCYAISSNPSWTRYTVIDVKDTNNVKIVNAWNLLPVEVQQTFVNLWKRERDEVIETRLCNYPVMPKILERVKLEKREQPKTANPWPKGDGKNAFLEFMEQNSQQCGPQMP